MLRDEPTIRPSLYRLPRDPVVDHVLVPAFRQAVRVRGAFGWFSAGWIPCMAAGLSVHLAKGGTAPIEFVISPELFPNEYLALKESIERREYVIQRLKTILEEAASPSADVLSRHAIDCLAWMVVNDRLRLRVAQVRPGGNYHPKVWLFYDNLDIVAVRGSANATGRAYTRAVEHMDVDCTWDNRARVNMAISMVDDWWNGNDQEIEQVLDLPDAIEQTLVRLAPKEEPYLRIEQSPKRESSMAVPAQNPEPKLFHIPDEVLWQNGKYAHQGHAVKAWETNGRRGVVAMATGAGKTITALICAYRAWQEHQGPFLLIISAPSTPLLIQWQGECKRFNINAVMPTLGGSKSDKHTAIGNCLLRLREDLPGQIEAMIITNALITTTEFQNALRDLKSRVPTLKMMHIGDEAHSLGSPKFIQQPPEFFDYRLALSATPERQYDDEGTVQLFRYFGPTAYEFGLDRAIGFCLVPYDYFVHIAYLETVELEEFRELSAKIGRFIARSGGVIDFSSESLTALLVKRRAVVESASGKIAKLSEIINAHVGPIRHTLVYTSSKDPNQLIAAKQIIANSGLIVSQVTEVETQDRTNLTRILDGFSNGDYDVLIAKRVLDEGVDIPQTKEAILLASSSVEREWVQRRGRILRPYPGKEFATLHDIIALPPIKEELYDDGVLQFISGELDRVRAFGRNSRNRAAILEFIGNIHQQYFKE